MALCTIIDGVTINKREEIVIARTKCAPRKNGMAIVAITAITRLLVIGGSRREVIVGMAAEAVIGDVVIIISAPYVAIRTGGAMAAQQGEEIVIQRLVVPSKGYGIMTFQAVQRIAFFDMIGVLRQVKIFQVTVHTFIAQSVEAQVELVGVAVHAVQRRV